MNAPLELADLIDLYLLRCQVEGKSPRTVHAYRFSLKRFLALLTEGGYPTTAAEVTREHLYGYLANFTEHSAYSRHRYFREVRCFFNWLVEAEYLEHNPFRGMKNTRLPHQIVKPYSMSQLESLLEAVSDGDIGVRDRALIFMLLDTGLRCSEALRLEVADLDLENGRIHVRFGKGNKQRVVPFARKCHEALVEYLDMRGDAPGPLFLAFDGYRQLIPGAGLQASGLRQMLRRLGRRAGVPKVHPHRFRHTFATWAIEHDARELDVQYLLGHSTPDMVRRYSSSYRSEQAATRHHRFSPADQMVT